MPTLTNSKAKSSLQHNFTKKEQLSNEKHPDWLGYIGDYTKDLTTLGYSFPLWGFDRRPQLMCGTRAAQELWRYFHSGGRAVRSLHKAWSIYHDHIS